MRPGTHPFDHGLPMTLLISVVYPLGPAAVILMPLIVGGVIDDYGLSAQQAGLIASSEGVGLVVGLLVGAGWVRRLSWRRMLFAGLAAYAAVNLIASQAETLAQLTAIRLLSGFCGGSVFAIVNAALGDNREPDRAFGLAQAVQGVMMFAAFTAAPLLPEGGLVSGLFLLAAATSVLLMFALFRFPDRGPEIRATAITHANGKRKPLIWLGLFGGLLYYASIFGFWDFIERMGVAAGLASDTVSLALGVSQIAAVGGGLVAALASDRFGRILPLAVAVSAQILVLWSLFGQFAAITYFVAASVYQGTYIVATSYMLGVIAKLDKGGKYVVVMNAVLGVGVAVGPSVAAALIRGGNYGAINLAAMVGVALTLILFAFIITTNRKNRE